MSYCRECGKKLEEKDKYCYNCGKKVNSNKNNNETDKDTGNDIEDNKGISVLSYLGILVFIPYFMASGSTFAMYHVKQGLNLLITWVIYIVLYRALLLIKVTQNVGMWYATAITPWYILFLLYILGACLIVLVVIGIVNVCNGKMKQLPIIGKINIIK